MSTSIINRVNDQLQEIEQQLGEFRTTVEYLQQAKKRVAEAENAVFAARDYHTEKLQDVEKIYGDFRKLSGTVTDLNGKISSIDFPKRLQSIDDSLASLLSDFSISAGKLIAEVSEAKKAMEKVDLKGALEELKKETAESTKILQDSANESSKKVVAVSETTNKGLQSVIKKIEQSELAQSNALAALKITSKFEAVFSLLQNIEIETQNNYIALSELKEAFENNRRAQNDQVNKLGKNFEGLIVNLANELKETDIALTELHQKQLKAGSVNKGILIAILILVFGLWALSLLR